MFSKSGIICKRIEKATHPPPFIECVWSLLPLSKIVLLALYVPPNLLTDQYARVVDYIISEADSALNLLSGSKLIITGDTNQLPTSDLESTLCLRQMVKIPTRGTAILDKILIDDTLCDEFNDPVIQPNFGHSDHMAVYINPMEEKVTPIRVKKVYDYRKSNISAFVDALRCQPWHQIYRNSESIDTKCDQFYTMITNALECIPFTFVEMSPRDKPWITPVVKVLIDLRYDAYRRGHFEKYQHYKEKTRKEIEKAKASWMKKLKSQPHGIWKAMKDVSCKHRPNVQNLDRQFSSASDAADALNSVFSSFFSEARVPQNTQLVSSTRSDKAWNVTITTEKTLKLLNNLKPGKSAGNDGLTPRLLKAGRDVLSGPLTHLFACSISSCSVPEKWKQAVVVPVPKVSNPSVTDFRPISLLPIPSKMLESIVLDSVKQELINTYGDNQFGFRPGSSTLDAHLAIHDEITRHLDCPETSGVAMIAMDLSKAFDRLSHFSLLQTLIHAQLPSEFTLWIKDFLEGRKQKVNFQGILSKSMVKVTSGVPQGSVLAPYLFASHMGTLKISSPQARLIKYADDITILIPFTKCVDLTARAQSEVSNVVEWCKSHGLAVNQQKTQTLLFSKPKPSTSISASLPNVKPQLKILGITFEASLKWSQHVKDVTLKAARRIHTLKQLKRIPNVTKEDLLVVYHNYVLSVMEYNSPLFVGLSKKDDTKMDRIRKRCHWIVCGSNCQCTSFTPIQTRRQNRAMHVFKRLQHPNSISHKLLPRRLPRTNHFCIDPMRTTRRANSFVPFCALRWNSCH